jgi:DNA-binding IclR family transcriptional regulator
MEGFAGSRDGTRLKRASKESFTKRMAIRSSETSRVAEINASETRPVVGKQDRHFVTALSRGLDVLSCFRSGSRMLGNQEISERCRLPKSTVSRLTYTLTKLGYLHYVKESGKYRLGTATLALGSAVLGRFEVRDLARPLMQELADQTGTSVALGARQRLSMVCVEVCKGNAVLSLNMEVGMRLPLGSSAIGRSYLAVCTDTERADLLDQLKELDHVSWPALKQGIDKSLATYSQQGVCTSFGEWQPDVNGIAVAFHPGNGLPAMAINCGAPAFKVTSEYLLDEVRPRLLDLVRKIEEGLGHVRV